MSSTGTESSWTERPQNWYVLTSSYPLPDVAPKTGTQPPSLSLRASTTAWPFAVRLSGTAKQIAGVSVAFPNAEATVRPQAPAASLLRPSPIPTLNWIRSQPKSTNTTES